MKESAEKPPPGETAPKKPYRAPVISYYGDIRAITESVGMTGMDDGMGAMKTH